MPSCSQIAPAAPRSSLVTFFTFRAIRHSGIFNGRTAFHNDLAAVGYANCRHTAEVAQNSTFSERDRSGTAVRCNHRILHIYKVVLTFHTAVFVDCLSEDIAFKFSRIIENNILQTQRCILRCILLGYRALASHLDHRGIIPRTLVVRQGTEFLTAGDRIHLITVAGDRKMLIVEPCAFCHCEVTHDINRRTVLSSIYCLGKCFKRRVDRTIVPCVITPPHLHTHLPPALPPTQTALPYRAASQCSSIWKPIFVYLTCFIPPNTVYANHQVRYSQDNYTISIDKIQYLATNFSTHH